MRFKLFPEGNERNLIASETVCGKGTNEIKQERPKIEINDCKQL
jgi:hypothetical protein